MTPITTITSTAYGIRYLIYKKYEWATKINLNIKFLEKLFMNSQTTETKG